MATSLVVVVPGDASRSIRHIFNKTHGDSAMPASRKGMIQLSTALIALREAGVMFSDRQAVMRAAGKERLVSPEVFNRALRSVRADDDPDPDVDAPSDDDLRKKEKDLQKKKRKAQKGRPKGEPAKADDKKKRNDDDEEDDDAEEDEDKKREARARVDADFASIERRLGRIEAISGATDGDVDEKLVAMSRLALGDAPPAARSSAAADAVIHHPAESEVDARLIACVENASGSDTHAQKMLVRAQKKLARMNKEVA